MSLGIRCLRDLAIKRSILSIVFKKSPQDFNLAIRSFQTNVVKLSAAQNPNNELKDRFNNNAKTKEPIVDDDDEDSFEHIRNMDQLKLAVLKKYINDEEKYNGKLIYVGGLTSQLKMAKILSLSSR